jgi:hypothetical protein
MRTARDDVKERAVTLDACSSGAVLGQPGGQVGGAAEIEQCPGQSLQLLKLQALDPDCGGVSQRAAAPVELAQGNDSSFSGTATDFSFLPTLLYPLLGDTGVAQVFGGNGGELHEDLASE